MAKRSSARQKYKYDLTAMETEALKAIASWKADDTQESRTQMFLRIKEITLAILEVGKWDKFELDFDTVAYEYALYLFERLVTGSFKAEPGIPGTRFPMQKYINVNLRHVVYKMIQEESWKGLLKDMEFLVDDVGLCEFPEQYEESFVNRMNKGYLARKIIRALKLYYSEAELKRLFHVSVELLYNNNFIVKPDWPKDIMDFSAIMVATAKRIALEVDCQGYKDVSRSSLEKSLSAAARSSIFLSTVANAEFFSRELLFSLDLESLYRLISVAGGKTLRVPTKRELDTLIGATVTVSKIILEGKEIDKAIQESKSDLDLMYSKQVNLRTFINSALESYNLFKAETPSQPLVNILLLAMKSLEKVMDTLVDRLGEENTDAVLKAYTTMTESCTNFTKSLVTIGSIMEKENISAED